jgi:hypothetical protein
MLSNGSPRLNFCSDLRLSTNTPHESANPASTYPRASACTETLCLTQLRPLCRPSFTTLPSTPERFFSAPSLAATAVSSRKLQLGKPSASAQPHTKPIGSREGPLPSSRCIRTARQNHIVATNSYDVGASDTALRLFGRNPAGLLIKVASNSIFARAAVIAREAAKSNYPRHALTIERIH